MQYVIIRNEEYVAIPGSKKSFTKNILNSRKYDSKYAADKDCCGNEDVVPLSEILKLYGIY